MKWLTPLQDIPEPVKLPPADDYTGKKISGRGGTPVTYLGTTYKSMQAAADAHGITRVAVRWRLLNK